MAHTPLTIPNRPLTLHVPLTYAIAQTIWKHDEPTNEPRTWAKYFIVEGSALQREVVRHLITMDHEHIQRTKKEA